MSKHSSLPSGVCLSLLLAVPAAAQSSGPAPAAAGVPSARPAVPPVANDYLRSLLAVDLLSPQAPEAFTYWDEADPHAFRAEMLEGDEAAFEVHPASASTFDRDTPAVLAQATPAPTPPTTSQPVPAPRPEGGRVRIVANGITLEGDEVEFNPDTGLYVLTGNPRAFRGEDEIRAERMILNPRSQQATAEGDVLIRQGGQEFRATRATYNFAGRQGLADNVTTMFGTYYVRANQIELKPGLLYEGRRVQFSTCPPEHGHYGVYTRMLEVKPGETITARNVGIDVFGLRLLTIPRITRSIREDEENERRGQVYPAFGYNSFTGPYARREFNLHRGQDYLLNADVRLNTFKPPFGGLLFGTPGKLQTTASLFYRDFSDNRSVRNLQVSRLPEVGLIWSPRERARPGEHLPHQIYGVNAPRQSQSTRWIPAAEISAGYFRQHRGDRITDADTRSKSGGRVRLQGQVVQPVVRLGGLSLNGLRFFARQTYYDTGQQFGVAGVGIGKQIRTGLWTFRADRFDQWTFGSTPFRFDDVELRSEWRPRIEYQSRVWSFAYTLRLNGNNGNVFDQWFSVSKLHHCLQPRLTYRTRGTDILFEIRIPGISGFGRTGAGGTTTVRDTDPGAPLIPTQHD